LKQAKGIRHEFITVEGDPHTFMIKTEKFGDYRAKIVSFYSDVFGKP